MDLNELDNKLEQDVKTITMDYDEYHNDLTKARNEISKVFKPLISSIEFYTDVAAGKHTIDPPMSHLQMLEEMRKTSQEVKQSWINLIKEIKR